MNLNRLSNRSEIPKYSKMKPKPDASHLVNYKKEKIYDYYVCDYCGEEIKITNKRQEMTGGILVLPRSLTRRSEMALALHNKCLKPTLKIFEEVKR